MLGVIAFVLVLQAAKGVVGKQHRHTVVPAGGSIAAGVAVQCNLRHAEIQPAVVEVELRDAAGDGLRQIGNYRTVVLLSKLRIVVDLKA